MSASILSLFFTGIAQGQVATSPILKATETSGYTLPIHAFERDCEVSTDGVLVGVLNENRSHGSWAISFPFGRTLTASELSNLKALIQTAKTGTLSLGQTVCDAGSTDISARVDADSENFIVVNSVDCKPRQINQSSATQDIQTWLKTECKIDIINQF